MTDTATSRTDAAEPHPTTRRSMSYHAGRLAVPGILVALALAFSVALPTFRTVSNFEGMVNSQAIVLMLALIAAITLRTGSFDLSIAQVMVGSGAITTVLSTQGVPLPLAMATSIAFGLLIGLIHAFLIVVVGADSFITTLGTLTALTGFTYAVTDSRIMSGLPQPLIDLSRAYFLGLPMVTWYAWLGVAVLWFLFEKAPIGRYLLFIGGNEQAARLAGLPVQKVRVGTFVMSAVLSSLTGILLVGQLGAVDPGMGSMFLLPPFAAVFLGSTAFTPGRFNALGTMAAVYLLVVGITGLQLMGVASWVSQVFNGLALVIAVTLAKVASGRAR